MRHFNIKKYTNPIIMNLQFNNITNIFKNLLLIIKLISCWFIVITAFAMLLLNMICEKIYKAVLKILTLILDLFEYVNINDKRRRVIHDRSYKEQYLIRYYIFLKDRNNFPFNIFIHKFMKGDDDEDIHDHPWGFFHIILSGGYWEEVPIDQNDLNKGIQKIWREPGYWNCVSADYKHRIELKDDIKPWTIFIPLNK